MFRTIAVSVAVMAAFDLLFLNDAHLRDGVGDTVSLDAQFTCAIEL
jgi:hypothetical protein